MTVEASFITAVSSVREARGIVVDELRAAGCAGDAIDDARLLTSELVTNAVRHAGSATYGLTVRVGGGILRVGVTDGDTALPADPERPADGAESGRGMWLLDLIARKWGVDASPIGKCVWFELACGAPAGGS